MYADKATEQKLVQAVKEAAQRIDYSSTTDPEAVVAECLMAQGLHEGFAKTATDALNKSYSVYYMSTHDDDTRGNDHTLLDSDKVKLHMCKESTPVCPHTSKPVEETPDVVVKRVSTVSKAASENHSEEYTGRTFNDAPEYLNWLSNNMLKLAKAYEEFTADTNMALENIFNRHKHTKEASLDNYTVQCLYKQGNTEFNDMLDSMGFQQEFHKEAMLGTSRIGTIKPVVPQNDTSKALCSLYKDASIVHTATKTSRFMKSQLDDLNEGLQELIQKYDYNCIMGKTAAEPIKSTGGAAAGLIFDAASIPAQMAIGSIGGMRGALHNIAENSRQMREMKDKNYKDVSVIDPVLLTEDRRVKNLEAVSEVLADQDLARYPVTDLFEVTQKLIKANPQFERPDMAPLLTDTVKQVMSQGSQIGLALHGATAKTISDIAKGRTNITGNDLYDIRKGITGEHGKPQIEGGISNLWRDTLAAGGESLESGVTTIAETTKQHAKAIADAWRDRNKRKLDKLKMEYEIQEANKKLLGDSPEERRRKAIKQELDDIKTERALAKEIEEQRYEKSEEGRKLRENERALKAIEAENKLTQTAIKDEKDKKYQDKLIIENKGNEGLMSMLRNMVDMDYRTTPQAFLGKDRVSVPDSASKSTTITANGKKYTVSQALVDALKLNIAPDNSKATSKYTYGLPSGAPKDVSVSGSTKGDSKNRPFSRGTSAGRESPTAADWVPTLKNRVDNAKTIDAKRDVLDRAYDMLDDKQKDAFKSEYGITSDEDAQDFLYSYYNVE